MGRRVKVEGGWLGCIRFCHGIVGEWTVGLADQEHLVAVLVDGVLRLGVGRRHKYNVDPRVVEGGDGYVVLDEGHGIVQHGCLGVEERVDGVVERPVVRLACDEHVQDKRLVGVVGRCDGRVGLLHGLVVVHHTCRGVATGLVDVWGGHHCGSDLSRGMVVDVGGVGDDLCGGVGGHAEREGTELSQLDEDGETSTVVHVDGLYQHGLDVGTVDGVQVHGVVVDGDVHEQETKSGDEVQGYPVSGGVVLREIDGGFGSGCGVAHVENVIWDG